MTSALQIWQWALPLQPSTEPRAGSTLVPKPGGSRSQKQAFHSSKGTTGQAVLCELGTTAALVTRPAEEACVHREAGDNRLSNNKKMEWEADDGCHEARWAQQQQLALSEEAPWIGTVKPAQRPHSTVNTGLLCSQEHAAHSSSQLLSFVEPQASLRRWHRTGLYLRWEGRQLACG